VSSWGSYRQSFPTINQTGVLGTSEEYNKLGGGSIINNKQNNLSEMNTLDRQYSCSGGGVDDQEGGVNYGGASEDIEYFDNHGIDDTPYTDKK
jgi:hypothetical protein